MEEERNVWDSDDEKYMWKGESPWRQEATPALTPARSMSDMNSQPVQEEKDSREENPLEALQRELETSGRIVKEEEIPTEELYSLDGTAEMEELVQKALLLQKKILRKRL